MTPTKTANPGNAPITSAFGARSTALDVVQGISLQGLRAVVTGGASGLGLETARALAAASADVTLAVRNVVQGKAAAAQMQVDFPKASVHVAHLDLSDLATVQSFAASYNSNSATASLDILVNNAAIMACPLTRNALGWEAQFATNHMGHFALTTALLPSLLRAAGQRGDARVVCLSSSGHKIAGVELDDVFFERRDYNKWKAYGQAKSANALFALGLHVRYAAQGITANAVHPGGIMTGLQKFLPIEEMRALGWLKADDTPLDLFKNPAQGASTSVWAATSALLKGHGGLYLEDCKQGLPADASNRVSGFSPHIADREGADRLWLYSEKLLASI